ncbi:cupin [Hwanghaeella grinnelliae]|uniref:Cupin n=1 Tax=Hwanghaeella grinnelliae TaxID=2500179 RepID=A0A437QPM0_9PROT|nr:cupin [Hwanghaeella grinnelliae]RVU36468.1 cupin [Hwanghaeella grinnelliae]
MTSRTLSTHPIHLGLGATAVAEPEFTGDLAWYEGYMERHATDGAEARIVAMHSFAEPWAMWEMHPEGSEVVLCTAGSITLHQEYPDGRTESVPLGPGEYAINEPGVWHTADVEGEATAIFITAGKNTQHRPR